MPNPQPQNSQPSAPKVNPQTKASLLSLLNLMINKAEKQRLEPVIRTSKLIDLLKTSGVVMSYHQLQDLISDPAVQQLVKDINKDEVTLRLPDDDEDLTPDLSDFGGEEEMPTDDEMASQEPSEDELPPIQDQGLSGESTSVKHNGPNIVSTMAARALKRS